MGADQECVKLAEHFLSEEPSLQERRMDLAYAIQACVEDWIAEQLESDRGAP